jgi:hypothetical protein
MKRKGMTDTEKFDALWTHVTKGCGHVPSPMMREVGNAMRQTVKAMLLAKSFAYLAPLRDLARKIADHKGWIKDGTANFEEMKCAWEIRNTDLELWGHLSLFGGRDFVEEWDFLSDNVGESIHKARIFQCYRRYLAGGRLTKEHRKLLRNMIWDQDVFRGDWVSIYVQGKRPFGDSSIAWQIARMLGWELPKDEDEDMPAETTERVWEIFDELRFAIHDALRSTRQRR